MVIAPFAPAFQAVGPACAAEHGDTLAPSPAPAGAPETPASRPQDGLPLDVFIQTAARIDQLVGAGLAVPGSRVDLGVSALAAGVKAGAPKPDISTREGLKRTLLQARSFGYSPMTSGNFLVMEVLPRLGVWDEVKGKGQVIRGEPVGAAVARGDVEIGFQQTPELLATPGVDLVGRLPQDEQLFTTYSAAIATRSTARKEAKAFIACLAGPKAAEGLRQAGFDAARPS
jgi:molybdate transport system substrate-binding protein